MEHMSELFTVIEFDDEDDFRCVVCVFLSEAEADAYVAVANSPAGGDTKFGVMQTVLYSQPVQVGSYWETTLFLDHVRKYVAVKETEATPFRMTPNNPHLDRKVTDETESDWDFVSTSRVVPGTDFFTLTAPTEAEVKDAYHKLFLAEVTKLHDQV